MDSLNVFKNYVNKKIEDIKLEQSKINYLNEIKNILFITYNLLSSREFTKINYDELRKALFSIYTDKNIDNKLDKMKEAISIIVSFGNTDIPQIKLVNEYLEEMTNFILNTYKGIELTIAKNMSEYNSLLSEYDKYLDLIEGNKIVRHLNEEELKEFFDFLNRSSIERETVLELTETFAKDSLEYASRILKIKEAQIQFQKQKNAKRVKREIEGQNRVSQIPSTSVSTSSLTEDEDKTYKEILSIVSTLEKDITLTYDSLIDILSNDYSLDSRTKVYASTDDKFNLILGDLKKNLLPNFDTNKNEIINIFNYIIHIYNSEYNNKKEKFVSSIADFAEVELSEIEKHLKIFDEELIKYNNLSDTDKNIIYSMLELIHNNEAAEISTKFSLEYVVYFDLLKQLNKLFNEYREYRINEEEYFELGLQDDANICLIELMSNIRSILTRLKSQNRSLNNTVQEEKEDSIQYCDERKTIFIFLPLSDGSYSICEDQKEICKIKKNVMKEIATGLYSFSRNDFYTYKNIMNCKEIEEDDKIPGYRDEIKPYRFRKGESRIAYAKLSVTSANQEKIKEAYNTSKADIILIIGCREKLNDSGNEYKFFNRRIAREISGIRHIIDLFSHDFDAAGFKEATTLIDDSDKLCEQLYKDPTKMLEANKSREGV